MPNLRKHPIKLTNALDQAKIKHQPFMPKYPHPHASYKHKIEPNFDGMR